MEAGKFEGLGEFPDDLQWEALVDVLRGRVKVNTHCYEAVDLDAFVRVSEIFVHCSWILIHFLLEKLTNEFKFPLAGWSL